jgi:hypothetical protein
MRLLRSRTVALVALVAGFIALEGCSGKNSTLPEGRVKARGRLLKNGLPIQVDTSKLPPGDPGLQIIFIRLGTAEAGSESPANVISATEGTFELAGPDGRGIAPGRYRVVVILAPVGSDDIFKGKYDKNKSKLEVEIKGGEDLVIDLDKPTG